MVVLRFAGELGGNPGSANPGEKLSFLAGAPPANLGIATPDGTAIFGTSPTLEQTPSNFISLT